MIPPPPLENLINFFRNSFTWSNFYISVANIKERLDIRIANEEWSCLFPLATIKHFPVNSYIHSPILLCTSDDKTSLPKSFQFASFWTHNKASSLVIGVVLSCSFYGSPAFILWKKSKTVKIALKK
jgi:hypothetical protein